VLNFLEIMGPDNTLPPSVKIACIGPVTAAAVKEAGFSVDILRERYTIPGLVDALVDYYRKDG
jgi:uroporphyrinogen III methyltransferase/synthase